MKYLTNNTIKLILVLLQPISSILSHATYSVVQFPRLTMHFVGEWMTTMKKLDHVCILLYFRCRFLVIWLSCLSKSLFTQKYARFIVSSSKLPAIHFSPLVKFAILSLSTGENISKIDLQFIRIGRQMVIKNLKQNLVSIVTRVTWAIVDALYIFNL